MAIARHNGISSIEMLRVRGTKFCRYIGNNEKEIQRISKKLDVYNKIVTLYKNSSDTVNKMGVGLISKEEKTGEEGEIGVEGIDIKIER